MSATEKSNFNKEQREALVQLKEACDKLYDMAYQSEPLAELLDKCFHSNECIDSVLDYTSIAIAETLGIEK